MRNNRNDVLYQESYADIHYDNYGTIVYEDYSKLEKMIENSLIANAIQIKTKVDKITGEEVKYPYITLKRINDKHLSLLEMDYTMNYLKNKGIIVSGTSTIYSGIYDNYECVGNSGQISNLPTITEAENYKLLIEYENTKNPQLREKIIVNNMKKAIYIASKYQIIYGIELSELTSFGFEGLIKAIDAFDSSKVTSATSYIFATINNTILREISNTFYKQSPAFYNKLQAVINETRISYPNIAYDNPQYTNLIFSLMKEYCQKNMSFYSDNKLKKIINHYLIISTDLGDDIIDIVDPVDYESTVIYDIDKLKIENLIDCVKASKRNKEIVKLYYGFGQINPVPVADISEMYGINRQRIYQIVDNILNKIRNIKGIEEYKSYLNRTDNINVLPDEVQIRK